MASDKKRFRNFSDADTDLEAPEGSPKRPNTLTGWLTIANPRVSVAIIGTAGRGGLSAKMSKPTFTAMVESAKDIVETTWKLPWSQIDLVSGGAAWADHVAVALFLLHHAEGTKLTLYMPCSMDSSTPPNFTDTGERDWRKNPGRSANRYHKSFSSALGYNTLQDFQQAAELGATLNFEHFGFHERNKQVAKVDNMLAYTFSVGEPEGGGTKHTWSLCTGTKVHVGLDSLSIPKDS